VATKAKARDAGEQQIDDLERDIVLAKDQLWAFNRVSPEEIARCRPGIVALAKAVADQLRSEYRARQAQQYEEN
jgi:hypothetical protein